MDDTQTDDPSREPDDGTEKKDQDDGPGPEPLVADADDVREFAERMVDEQAAPMTEQGIINNP